MAALSSPAIAFLAVLGVAGSLRTHPPAPQSLRPDDRLHQAAVDALAAGKLLVAARRLPDPNFGNAVNRPIPYGYLPVDFCEQTDFTIEVYGEAIPAVRHDAPVYDPTGARLRA